MSKLYEKNQNIPKILWRGTPNLNPNIWGFRFDKGRMRLYLNHVSYTGVSPIAILIFSLFFAPTIFFIISSTIGIISSIIFAITYLTFLLYWYFIREVKYYQITKSMQYEITESNCIFRYKYFGKEFVKLINISKINHIHLVEFEEAGVITGSIHVYYHDNIKFYKLSRKERSHGAVIERVLDFNGCFDLIGSMINKNHR